MLKLFTVYSAILKKLFVLILSICTQYCFAHAQTKIIDSLRNKIVSEENKSRKLADIFAFCGEYRSMHPDSLGRYITMAKTFTANDDDILNIANTEYFEAIYLNRLGKTDSALLLIDKNILLLKNKSGQSIRDNFSLLKSNILIRNNRQKESIQNSLALLHEAELEKDIAKEVKAKTMIGWAYMELGQNRDALNWLLQTVETWQKKDTAIPIAVAYNNIAAVYNELKKNDSAAFFILKGIEHAKKEQNLTFLTNGYYIYSDICAAEGKIVKAEDLLKQGLQIRKEIGDVFYVVSDLAQLGIFYSVNKQPSKGIEVVKEGITIAEKNNLYAKLPFLYAALAQNYKAAGDLAAYSNTLNKIISLKDSLYKRNNAEALAEMQAKYELQKKETTILHQQYDLAKKNFFIYGIAALLAATLLFGFFFFKNRKRTQYLKLQALQMEQKKKITQAVMQAEEDERKRIAGDLHDSVAQKIVAAKLNLEVLGNQLNGIGEPGKKIYSNINSLLEESTTEVRNLSHSMMPQAFALSGLANTIKNFLDKIETTELSVHFSAEGDFTDIKENTALMIYRIIQECVQNVLKHARATKLDISVMKENNELDITIEDNGIGFNTESTGIAESNGIKNIRTRIQYLNGKCDINSSPGNGTIIAFYIPL